MTVNLQVTQVLAQGYGPDGVARPMQPLVISAEYHNLSEHASGPFHVTFTLDHSQQHVVEVDDLWPQQPAWAQWPLDTVNEGEHTVRVQFAGVSHESEHVGEAYDQVFAVENPPPSGAALDSRDEHDMALHYIDAELGVLRQWEYALLDFDKVMVSETQSSANPKFGAALLKFFETKVFGAAVHLIPAAAHADLIFGALQAVVDEAERAKTASVSVALRDFYHAHMASMSAMDKNFTLAREQWVDQIPGKLAALLADGKADEYLALRNGLLTLHDDAMARLSEASLDAYVDALSAEWINQSSTHYGKAEVHVRIRLHDLSVIDFKIEGPDGDKLAEHLAAQNGGIDLWHLPVPRHIAAYEKDDGWYTAMFEIDPANKFLYEGVLGEGTHVQEVYERLRAQGHLIAHNAG